MSKFLRPSIRSMAGYVPGEQPRGEQPRGGAIIKLNTNENPYPPSPRVLEAIGECLKSDRLRKYPDPLGLAFRQTAARLFDVDPAGILIGNGSDDVLTVLTRAFVPESGTVISPTPSYLLYATLAEIQGAKFEGVPFTPTWKLPRPWPRPKANLTLVANPNSPTGTLLENSDLEALAHELDGPLVVDEAYVDFAPHHAISLTKLDNVIVTRTFSKSYSLAGLRFGFAIASPALVHEFNKVKDSYNCDVLSLAGAQAALEDQDYLRQVTAKILATRARLTRELRALGFDAMESHANFVWTQRTDRPVKPIFEALKAKNILIRYMVYDGFGDGLRISVGTDAEIDQLLTALNEIL